MGLEGQLPAEARIPVNPREHKRAIGIFFTILPITSGILPAILYFAFKYGAHLDNTISVTIPSVIFGVSSLFQLFKRTYVLAKKNSTARPIGSSSRWHLDYFQWNFIFGFIYITILIAVGSSGSNPKTNLRIVSMSLPLLLYQVCLQMLVGQLLRITGSSYPFRFSSLPKGVPVRAAVYTIVEDLLAVDANQGTDGFRKPWNARWDASLIFQQHLIRMDWMWGVSGTALATALVTLTWTISNAEITYGLCWLVPWAWAGIFAFASIKMTDRMLRKENEYFGTSSARSSESV